jgi:hypothetical protein
MVSLNLIKASDGLGEAARASVNSVRSPGSSVIDVGTAPTHWPTTQFVAETGKVLADGSIDPTTQLVFYGHTSGSNIVIDSLAPGYTDPGSSSGFAVLLKPTTAWADNIHDTLAVSLNDNGTISSAGITQVTGALSNTQLRLKPRISVTTSTSTLTPNIAANNIYELNAQSTALTIANPTGTANDGDVLVIRIKDNGSSQAITYGTAYSNVSGLDTLVATVSGKWHYIGCMYNATATVWQVISITTSA